MGISNTCKMSQYLLTHLHFRYDALDFFANGFVEWHSIGAPLQVRETDGRGPDAFFFFFFFFFPSIVLNKRRQRKFRSYSARTWSN